MDDIDGYDKKKEKGKKRKPPGINKHRKVAG